MPNITDLKLVTLDNVHDIIPNYITENNIIITTYEDMMDTVLRMIREKHLFNMDRDLLRDCLTDLVYMYCPGDDLNRDRVVVTLEPSDEEDEGEGEVVEDIPLSKSAFS
tara:strand:- start:1155 stop:1481 length:327 start_codon:yes stop_codon:yes gene_type:complete